MTQPTREDLRLTRELAGRIREFDLDASRVLPKVLPTLQRLLRAESAGVYTVVQGPERLEVPLCEGVNLPAGYERSIADYIARRPFWGCFNALRPEPWQRGAVLRLADLERRGFGVAAPRRDVLGPIGLDACDQLRTLICDGPVLLAWVGGLRREPFGERERSLFSRLVRPLQQRLKLERYMAEARLGEAALDAALEAIPAASFVLSASGGVLHANHAGKAWLSTHRQAGTQALSDALRGRPSAFRFNLTELAATGVPSQRLAVLKMEASDPTVRLSHLARRVGLTPRQAEVLGLLARGYANKTIAAMLGRTDATVEVHVGKLLEKVQVENRAALVAWFWTTE